MTPGKRFNNSASDPNSHQRRTGGGANDPHGGHEHAAERRGQKPDPVEELVPAGSGALPPGTADDKERIEGDARGQYGKSQADRSNSGLSSATPRAVTGQSDATLANATKKASPKPAFDVRSQTNKRD